VEIFRNLGDHILASGFPHEEQKVIMISFFAASRMAGDEILHGLVTRISDILEGWISLLVSFELKLKQPFLTPTDKP